MHRCKLYGKGDRIIGATLRSQLFDSSVLLLYLVFCLSVSIQWAESCALFRWDGRTIAGGMAAHMVQLEYPLCPLDI